MTLYHYWRSSSSWRVRWALKYKQQEVKFVHVSLVDGESDSPQHLARNPLGYVPALEHEGRFIIESVAIIEWLEEKVPERPLYPVGLLDRAQVRGLVEIINSDTAPIQNPTVTERHTADEIEKKNWNQHFIRRGLEAFQVYCKRQSGLYSFGDKITAADLFLIPQCYNALRFEVPLSDFPILEKIYSNAMKTKEAQESLPELFKPN